MSRVRLLIGTRKGAFILTSDAARRNWQISEPHFPGWELYHLKGSPVDPNRIYASQTSRLVRPANPALRRRRPNLAPVGNQFTYDGVPGTHQWYDGTPHPWEFKRVWHLEPSLTDPDTVFAGVEDAGLFKSTDGGDTWHELSGLRHTRDRPPLAARRRRPLPPHHHPRPRPTPTASSSPSPPPAPSAPTTPAKPGSPSTKASTPNTSPTPPPKSATASTTSP